MVTVGRRRIMENQRRPMNAARVGIAVRAAAVNGRETNQEINQEINVRDEIRRTADAKGQCPPRPAQVDCSCYPRTGSWTSFKVRAGGCHPMTW